MTREVMLEVEKLRRASLAVLREKHLEVFQEETQCRHRQHLFRRIAWRMQALAEGDLTGHARERATEIVRDVDLRWIAPKGFFVASNQPIGTDARNQNRRLVDTRIPLPGTLLKREWKGQAILVEVLAVGFRYENRPYSSLSAIATEITGTRWNGLAFFGLTRKAGKNRNMPKGGQHANT